MASKIIRMLTTVVSNDKTMTGDNQLSLTLLATDATHEKRDEFKAFVKMCQVFFSFFKYLLFIPYKLIFLKCKVIFKNSLDMHA